MKHFNEPTNRKALSERGLGPLAGRVPPNDLDAEAAVLSSILLSPAALDEVQGLLPEHFYSDANKEVYEAVIDLQGTGTPADLVSVAARLKDKKRLDRIGGTPYLHQLANATPAVAHVDTHARIVREKWLLRKLIYVCSQVTAEAYAGVADNVHEFIDWAEQEIFGVARTSHFGDLTPLYVAAKDARTVLAEANGAVTGLQTGFEELDTLTTGLHPGDLVIVAGRPGMGKTAYMLHIVWGVSQAGQNAAAIFSLEMPQVQLAYRYLAKEAGVDLRSMRAGSLSAEDFERLDAALERLRVPIYLDDTSGITLLELRAKVRRLKARLLEDGIDLALIAVDYVQLMRGAHDRTGRRNREQEISQLTSGLKEIAKEFNIAVVAVSQLNRGPENRQDKRPQLSDLRESGAIEQDADLIMFVYRDDYYHRESLDAGLTEIIVAKHRNGPTGMVRLEFDEASVRFSNLEANEYDFDDFDSDRS